MSALGCNLCQQDMSSCLCRTAHVSWYVRVCVSADLYVLPV